MPTTRKKGQSGSCGRSAHLHTFCAVRRPASWVIVAALFVAVAACGDSGGDQGPTATIAKPGKTTTTHARTVEQQVEAAYLQSWKVYARAMRSLDASGLDSAFARDALMLREQEV